MELFEKASELKRYNIPFALVTLLETSSTAPRSEGRMIVTLDGKIFGTVGGGAMEKAASVEALLALKENKGRRVKLPVRKDGMAELFIDIPVKDKSYKSYSTTFADRYWSARTSSNKEAILSEVIHSSAFSEWSLSISITKQSEFRKLSIPLYLFL